VSAAAPRRVLLHHRLPDQVAVHPATEQLVLQLEIADRLVRGALDLEARRNALKASCYDRLKSAISPKTAARFLQVENQILLLLDLQIAASLPVIK
jgi:hypothetical protein